jgi:hypothetical protein
MAIKTNITLDFEGPYTFLSGGTSVFLSPCATSRGVYLWTIRQREDDAHLIHYVGETKSLGKRHRKHLTAILGLDYGIFGPDRAQEGVRRSLWRGLWREKAQDAPSKLIEAYQTLHDGVTRYLAVVNIFFAEIRTELEIDKQLRKHIEGCIGLNLRKNHPESKTLYPDDNHIGTMPDKDHGELMISCSQCIRGLDSRIRY